LACTQIGGARVAMSRHRLPYFCDWKPGRFRTTSLIR